MSIKVLISLLLVGFNLCIDGRRHRGLSKDDVQVTSAWWPRALSATEKSGIEHMLLLQPPKVPLPVHDDPKRQKVFRSTERNVTWPYREQVVVVEGDIILGGLMMVHERHNELICGKVMPQGGIQATEVMLYTIDYVNRIQLIPGIRLGARIKDDCDRDIYGLEQSVDFIRGYVSKLAGGASSEPCPYGDHPQLIAGVVGAPSSVTSIQVANLLKLFKIPQVSFFSTSPALSFEDRFPYFMRTIPSDKNQAEVMVNLVKLFNWTYVSIVYEESSYGQMGYSEVEELLKKEGICIAVTEKLIKDSGVAIDSIYEKIVERLKSRSMARGVIVFGSDQEVGDLMRAIHRANLSGYFSWIGSDGWGGRTIVSNGNEAQVEGAITVQPYAEPVEGFEEYFLGLTPENNQRNPWFTEYWEDYFQCRVRGSIETPFNQNYSRFCDRKLRQTKQNGYQREAQLQFVSDAVLAFAHALKNMHDDYCGVNHFGLCLEMDPYNGALLKEYLLNVNFTGLSKKPFQFLANGDAPPRYRILNFRQKTPGRYTWNTVGLFENMTLTVNMTDLQFTLNQSTHPESICSRACAFNQARHNVEGDQCCWTCVNCSKYQYLPTPLECVLCPLGSLPSPQLGTCLPIPERYLTNDNYAVIVAKALAGLGEVVTIFIIGLFIKYRDTPVAKASGRELSFVLLGGVLICYAMTFVIVAPPSNAVCGAQKFGIGFCFTVCYSALLVKTNRIARIFRAGRRTIRRPRLISPRSQLFICFAIISIQLLIGVTWLILSPPAAAHYHPTHDDNQLVCLDAIGSSYAVGFAFPILLIIVCTYYAVMTRRIPEAFNESQHIGFTMYTTCVIWLAFVPIYFSTANNIFIRLVTMSLSISLSATVSLACLFAPKVYLMLVHPERNVRQTMMARANVVTTTVNSSSLKRIDSGEIEMKQRLNPSGSLSSGLCPLASTATQTTNINCSSISTQTASTVDKDA